MASIDEAYCMESGTAIPFVTEEDPPFPDQLLDQPMPTVQSQEPVAVGPYRRVGPYAATLRRRVPPETPQLPSQPPPPQTAVPTRMTGRKHSWWLRAKRAVQQAPTVAYASLFGYWWMPPRDAEARELWWEEVYYPHMEPKLVRLWTMQKRLVSALLLLWLLWSALIYLTEKPVEHVEEELQQSEIRLQLARNGTPGVDFALTSSEFLCSELKTGILDTGLSNSTSMIATSIDLLEPYAEQYMRAEYLKLQCVCAPMFGLRRQLITVRVGQRLVHMYNPEMDRTWRPEHYSPDTEYSVVPEWQSRLFPNRTDSVENLRRNYIRVQFRQTENCGKRAVILHAEDAYCVQQCLDLFRGVTVYDRALVKLEDQVLYRVYWTAVVPCPSTIRPNKMPR